MEGNAGILFAAPAAEQDHVTGAAEFQQLK